MPETQQRPPRGFIKPRYCYVVRIDGKDYHKGFTRRAAVHAFKRAQQGYKGTPASAEGKLLVLMKDGLTEQGVDANGQAFRI